MKGDTGATGETGPKGDKVIQLLGGIELYALECFNVTARHKAEVQELKTVKEVEDYDVEADYPEQLDINI